MNGGSMDVLYELLRAIVTVVIIAALITAIVAPIAHIMNGEIVVAAGWLGASLLIAAFALFIFTDTLQSLALLANEQSVQQPAHHTR